MTLRIVTIRSIIYFALMTVITGIIYPLAVTAIAKVAFPYQANGSIIRIEGRKYGAENLGQLYRSPAHLWGRQMNIDTSFTGTDGKPAAYAWPSNLSPAGEKLEGLIADSQRALETNDVQHFLDLDAAFHLGIAEATNNEDIISITEGLLAKADVHMWRRYKEDLGLLGSTIEAHHKILSAIKERDTQKAGFFSEQHLARHIK